MSPDAPRLAPRAFWFLRHGETDWNANGLAQGAVDVPLNETGRAQARAAASLLRHRGITAMVASPLGRARVTAEIVAEALDLTVAFDDDLREVAFGVQEGRPMTGWFDDWVSGTATPQGAESFDALRVRAIGAANRALQRPAPVLMVAHGGWFRAIRAEMGLPPNLRTPNGVPIFCTPGTPPGTPWTLSAQEAHPDGGMTNRR